jgi:imidazolonepropionase-like amidohydrolase
MRRVGLLLSFLLLASALLPIRAQQPASSGGAVLFEGARLIVGDTSAPVDNSAFIVENGRFGRVGRRGEIALPAGATRVDLTGKTVMPAIIDGHSHFGYTSARSGTTALENYTRENLIEDLQRSAYYGVGMTMSMGNDGGHGDLPWKLQDEDIPNAARWRTAGPGISTPNGGQGGVRGSSWTTVRTEAEARQAVQALAPHKPDLVKIWVDDRGRTVEAMSPAMYGAVIDEAHKRGLRVAAHIVYLEDAKGLVRGGIDGLAHSVREQEREVDDELVQLLKQHPNVWMTPLLPDDPARADDYSWLAETLPAAQTHRLRDEQARRKPNPEAEATFARLARNLKKVMAAGTKIGVGTDTGNMGGVAAHYEMWDMVTAGMTPAQAITAATRNTAEILGEDRLVGTVTAGKSADFIVLDANPLEDIRNTRKIAKVFLRGHDIDRRTLGAKLAGARE